jgi:lysozyme family protein
MATITLPPSPRALYCISVIIGLEGGLVNNPNDPGGLTKFGISKRSYPNLDIANLTYEQAQAIYFRDYWVPLRCSQLPKQLDLYVLDAGVNQGVHSAIIMLQAASGLPPAQQDGQLGLITLAAANKCAPMRFMAERMLRYAASPKFHIFGLGWAIRLFNITSK